MSVWTRALFFFKKMLIPHVQLGHFIYLFIFLSSLAFYLIFLSLSHFMIILFGACDGVNRVLEKKAPLPGLAVTAM